MSAPGPVEAFGPIGHLVQPQHDQGGRQHRYREWGGEEEPERHSDGVRPFSEPPAQRRPRRPPERPRK